MYEPPLMLRSLAVEDLDGATRPLTAALGSPETIPWIGLCTLPTPLRRLPAAGELPAIWIKDDGVSACPYGGNKARKLEFVLADALAKGRDEIWTIGGIGSHHALATALYAERAGLRARILHFAQPTNEHVERVLFAVASTKARLQLAPSTPAIATATVRQRLVDLAAGRGRAVEYVPAGGSSSVGALGYVNAGLECAAQLRSRAGDGPLPDRVYVAAGTAGTMAGIIIGLGLAGLDDVEVVGVRVTPAAVCNTWTVRSLLRRVRYRLERAGLRTEIAPIRWTLRGEQLGDGYGVPTAAGERARKRASDAWGVVLDPTYTAKTFAAIAADAAAGVTERPLYWHTLNAHPLDALVAPRFDPSYLPPAHEALLRALRG